jgi:hypothetical protein
MSLPVNSELGQLSVAPQQKSFSLNLGSTNASIELRAISVVAHGLSEKPPRRRGQTVRHRSLMHTTSQELRRRRPKATSPDWYAEKLSCPDNCFDLGPMADGLITWSRAGVRPRMSNEVTEILPHLAAFGTEHQAPLVRSRPAAVTRHFRSGSLWHADNQYATPQVHATFIFSQVIFVHSTTTP